MLADSDSEETQKKVIFVPRRGSNSGVRNRKEEGNNSDDLTKVSDGKVGAKKCGCTRFSCDGRHTLLESEKEFRVTKI